MKESNAPVTGRTPFQKWLDKYQGILYLIPWIIGFVVFKAFPFGQSLYYSFTDMNFFKSGTTFVGLQNYITAFTTTKITKALLITFKYAFITVPLKLVFALFIAYILNFKIACVNLFRTVYYIPSILGGSVAIAVLWKAVFSVDGLLNTVLRAVTFGLVQGPEWLSDPSYALWIICFLRIWQFGSAMVLFLACLLYTSHVGQRVGGTVLRSHLQLAGHMVLYQFLEEGVVRVGHEVIKTDAAADEHFLHTRQLPHPAQDLEIIAVVHDHVGAGGGGQAVLAAIAHAPQHLLAAGWEPEVGGGTADIVDVALEIRLVGHALGFRHDAVRAAAGDTPPLMQLDGAEVAPAEAAAVLDDGELHLADGRHTAHGLVDGVVAAGVGQGVDLIQLPADEGLCGDVLHEVLLALLLDDDLAADDVLIVHLDAACLLYTSRCV